MRSHQWLGLMLHRTREHRHGLAIAAVAERDRDVAQKTTALGAFYRALSEAAAEAVVVQRHQVGHKRHQFGGDSRIKRLVPGTYFLADIAAENPVAEFGPQLARNRAAIFDGEIRDA